MAFYIESRFVDIRTLVDFSEFDETGFNSTTALNTTNPDLTAITTNTSLLPIQSSETLNNSQAIQEVTKIVVENENKSVNSNETTNNISSPLSSDESALINQLSENISPTTLVNEPVLPPAKIEIVDKTSLYTQYINQKYAKDTAAELIKILLNPYIVILAYRYELDETKDNLSSVNLRMTRKNSSLPGSNSDEDLEGTTQKHTEQKNLRELLEYNRKKDLERRMQRQAENF